MADNASQMWRTQFADRTMAIYQQRGGRLRGMVQSTDKFNGSATARFYLAGKSTAYRNHRRRPAERAVRHGHHPVRRLAAHLHGL
jgi:hypothetical protein